MMHDSQTQDIYLNLLNNVEKGIGEMRVQISELNLQVGKLAQHIADMEIVGGGVRCLEQEKRIDSLERWRKTAEKLFNKINGRITLVFVFGIILAGIVGYESKDLFTALKPLFH